MKFSSMNDIGKPKKSDPEFEKKQDQISDPKALFNNPDYIKLLEHFQLAEFSKCEELLSQLAVQFPNHPALINFKDDLEFKLSIKKIQISNEKEEKLKKKKSFRNMMIFAIGSFILVLVAIYFSYNYFNAKLALQQQEEAALVISSLEYQAEQLMNSGQPQTAVEIIDRIRMVDPEYENLPALENWVNNLLRLESEYATALDLMEEERYSEAKTIFDEIEATQPGMWDVPKQIAIIETSFEIDDYLVEGNTACQAGEWSEVIAAYENALALDPDLDDPVMQEQLLNAYLNMIISILDNDQTGAEDIENAEEYYRKAITMASQSKAFVGERENLQKASDDLLKMKYAQIAKDILSDKNQTVTSVDKAISYMREAASIDPANGDLRYDLQNAENYQIAYKNFMRENWEGVIDLLNQLPAQEPDYANGNARELLFNAYYELGKRYDSLGLYLDALRNFEKAENLAWSDTQNLLKLFQVQTIIGTTYGQLNDFRSAASYYQYALNAIQADERLIDYPDLAAKLDQAYDLNFYGKYEESFNTFNEVLDEIDVLYAETTIDIDDGVCLALFAGENLSTVDAIIAFNNLPESMVITFGRELLVPIIEKY